MTGARRRLGRTLLGAALTCLLTGLLLPPVAGAAREDTLQVALPGAAFTSHPDGALFDVRGVAPGGRTSAVLGVRGPVHTAGTLLLQLIDVHDDDNGCTAAEALVDRSCGTGGGELASVLTFTVAAAASPTGPFRSTWTGTSRDLEAGADISVPLPMHADRWLRVTVTVAAAAGNAVQSDSIGFRLRVALRSSRGVSGVTVGPGGTGTPHGVGGIAYTGASVALLVVGGALLVAAGLMMGRRPQRG